MLLSRLGWEKQAPVTAFLGHPGDVEQAGCAGSYADPSTRLRANVVK